MPKTLWSVAAAIYTVLTPDVVVVTQPLASTVH